VSGFVSICMSKVSIGTVGQNSDRQKDRQTSAENEYNFALKVFGVD